MENIVAVVLVAWGWWQPGGAKVDEPMPPSAFFAPVPNLVMYGPPLPDPDVPTCAANDRACLEAHDAAALSAALASQDDSRCQESRTPAACRDAYDMITGNVGMKADPILDDPCSWVVLVDRGIATIESRRTGARRRYTDRGWKPMTFLGKCDLSKLSSRRVEALSLATPLPTWVPRRTARQAAPPAPVPATPAMSPAAREVTQTGQRPASEAAQSPPMPAAFIPVSTIKP